MHQAKSWKLSSDNFEKDYKRGKDRAVAAEAQLKAKEDELAQAHVELVKQRSDKKDLSMSTWVCKNSRTLWSYTTRAFIPYIFLKDGIKQLMLS